MRGGAYTNLQTDTAASASAILLQHLQHTTKEILNVQRVQLDPAQHWAVLGDTQKT
jgi:hypothetical protein